MTSKRSISVCFYKRNLFHLFIESLSRVSFRLFMALTLAKTNLFWSINFLRSMIAKIQILKMSARVSEISELLET